MTEAQQVKEFIGDLEMSKYELVLKNATMKTFVLEDTEIKVCLHVTIKNLEVKYLPRTYDKLVMIPDEDTLMWLNQWQEHAGNVEPYIKKGLFGCKAHGQLREEINKSLKEGDIIDIVITYNGVSLFQEKWYPSFTLQQFRKVKSVRKKTVNLFVD